MSEKIEEFKGMKIPNWEEGLKDIYIKLQEGIAPIDYLCNLVLASTKCGNIPCEDCILLKSHKDIFMEYMAQHGKQEKEGKDEVREFQVGDKVKCVDASIAATADVDNGLIEGHIYTIGSIRDSQRIILDGICRPVWRKRFKTTTSKTTTTKEETMKKAIEDNFEKTKDANLVEAELPGSKLTEFVNDHLVKIYAKEILAEAKRLKKEREEV